MPQPSEDGIVCAACVQVNPPHADYCAKCGAPLNSLLGFNPFDQTLFEGFAYRRAVDGPPSKIILVGMWLLFVPGLLAFPVSFISGLANPSSRLSVFGLLCQTADMGAYFLASLVILYRTTANYFAKRRTDDDASEPMSRCGD